MNRITAWMLTAGLVLLGLVSTAPGQDAEPASAEPSATIPSSADDAPEAGAAPSETPSAAPAEPSGPRPPIAATVNGDAIFVAEVDSGYETLQKTGMLANANPEDARAEILEQLINRRLASRALERDPTLIKESEIEQQMRKLEANSKRSGDTLDQACRKSGIEPETLRQMVIWQITSPRYIERDLADDLEKFFKENQQELDGTEIRASHIVLRPLSSSEKTADVVRRAERIREEITSGKIDFATAAKKYSMGPSRDRGGDIGFIPRQGVMYEQFADALFSLKPGEVSQPVVGALCTHLITATGANPGGKTWTQVVPQIRQVAMLKKVKALMDEERKTAKIEYTGSSPHFEPGTKKVAGH